MSINTSNKIHDLLEYNSIPSNIRQQLHIELEKLRCELKRKDALIQKLETTLKKKLKASEERYKTLLEASPSGISLTNTKGKRIFVSKKSAEIFGFDSPEEMLQQSSINSIHPENLERAMKGIKKVVALNGKSSRGTYKGLRKNGEEFYFEATGRLIENNGEQQILMIYNDATEKVKTEKALAQKNKELEKYIEYSLQLENFAHLASHDLREPLINIQSITYLLEMEEEDNLSETTKTYLGYIQDSSKRMEQLLSELLDYSTIGKYSNPTPVNCNEIINNTLNDLSMRIKKYDATIQFPNLPTIYGHKKELRSLFQNLISNALKYRQKDIPPIIQIHIEEKEHHWQFAFKDNSIGIAPQHYNKIFLIYKRLNTQPQEEKSTGIGLAYCKKVVELHQGKIWVESELRKGSTFYFTIHKNLHTS